MSVKSESEVEVNVERIDSDISDDVLASAAILRDIYNDEENTITVEPSVEELISGDLPGPTIDGPSFVCTHCGKLYKSAGTLRVHMQLKHPPQTGGVEVRCVSCDKTYASLLSLQKHQRYMHRFSHRCKACYRTFETGDQLAVHTTSCVMAERPCPTCGKMYESQLSLRNHIKYKHPEVKSNWCGVCRRAFKTDRGLVNHVSLKHPDRIECSSCDMKFNSVTALQSHDLYKHSKNSHRCSLCKKVFASRRRWSRHLSKNHNVVVYDGTSSEYVCGVCEASFRSSSVLIQHVMDEHTGVKNSGTANADENK